ncbi:MAG: PAS domain-containing sensor histidine kinase [Chloroflexi bacterium]|nr:PAS domain-containing sensor histidine kinase [Chloroflexota bacterium]
MKGAPARPSWARFQSWLYPYRPRVRDWRFWAVQGLVLFVGLTHTILEALEMQGVIHVEALFFWPTALYFIPVVYAALNYGLSGSAPTAVWCTVLSIPNWIWFHTGVERVGCISQVAIVDALAFFVGQRVDREMAALRSAEAAASALKASEARYRSLFQSSPVAVLLLSPAGAVLEANPAAGALFSRPSEELKNMTVGELLGEGFSKKLMTLSQGGSDEDGHWTFRFGGGREIYLEPAFTLIREEPDGPMAQLLLRDVTEEMLRQEGLRAYAAHILRAQEDERKRIAQELHDETVQTLVLLCRQLDAVEISGNSFPVTAMEELRKARQTVEGVVGGLRDFARALRPPTLEDLGLLTSVRRLLLDLTERTQTRTRLQVEGNERRLPADAELGLFRIVQEAVRNVERHSRASQVTATIAFNEGSIRLTVLDNGVGFRLPPGGNFAGSGQLGLLGMQERAQLLGGHLEIQSTPGKGTRVSFILPLGGK